MGLEPTTFSLATRCSTTELCPHLCLVLLKELIQDIIIQNFYFVGKTAMPGKSFPSKNSNDAPPPVDT